MDERFEKYAAFNAGRLYDAWNVLGAHPTDDGTDFAVWAPDAQFVSVTGDFCGWDGQGIPREHVGYGIWQGFNPQAREWGIKPCQMP